MKDKFSWYFRRKSVKIAYFLKFISISWRNSKMNVRAFLTKNLLAIVMVPAIIGSHYTWYKLQEDDRLVSKEERDKLPMFTFFKKIGALSGSSE